MKPKHLPRLWCALQGLLPLDACLAAQRGELAWPPEPVNEPVSRAGKTRNRVATRRAHVNVARRGSV
jgi:hypothetical protein